MLLQGPFPPPSRGKRIEIADLSGTLACINNPNPSKEEIACMRWLRGEKNTTASGVVTFAVPFPTPLAIWCAPFNISVLPCVDDSVTVVVYGLNQVSEKIGSQRRLSSDDNYKHGFGCAEQEVHVRVNVYPRSAYCHGGNRDNMVKFPAFYEVEVTFMFISRMRVWTTNTKHTIGDWVRRYALGNVYWGTSSCHKKQGLRKMVPVKNDNGTTRMSAVISSSKKRGLSDRVWIHSRGVESQGRRNATLDVVTSHDEIRHSKHMNKSNIKSTLIAVDVLSKKRLVSI